MERRKVLITGAAGRVGRALVRGLGEGFSLRGFDRTPAPECEDFHPGDLSDLELLTRASSGMDAVVHLAGSADPGAPWELVLGANIVGTRNALEAARRAGVRRFVYASRAGLVAQYPDHLTRGVDFKPCPTDLYSVSKCFGESLGYHYSVAHGLEVVCVRIGNYTAGREAPTHPHHIGEADLVSAFERALVQPRVQFEIFFAVSDSTYPLYDLDHGRQAPANYPGQKSSWSRLRLVRAWNKLWKG